MPHSLWSLVIRIKYRGSPDNTDFGELKTFITIQFYSKNFINMTNHLHSTFFKQSKYIIDTKPINVFWNTIMFITYVSQAEKFGCLIRVLGGKKLLFLIKTVLNRGIHA